jgi:hypothetical protein
LDLSGATKLAVVVLNVPALLIVPHRGIPHPAISFLAAGLQRVSVDMNVRTGLGKRASGAVIAMPVALVIIMISIAVMIAAVCIAMVVASVAIIASARSIAASAGATEVSVQVLDFSVATIKITEFSVAPVAALVLAGGRQR